MTAAWTCKLKVEGEAFRVPRALLIVLVTGALVQSGCAQKIGAFKVMPVEPGYPVKDSRWKADYSQKQVYWLDDRRIMFIGYPTDRTQAVISGGYDAKQSAIYIWDTATDAVVRHADVLHFRCYVRATGYVRYTTKEAEIVLPDGTKGYRTEWKYGPMGREKTKEVQSRRGVPYDPTVEPDHDMVCEDSNQLRPQDGRVSFVVEPGKDFRSNSPLKWYPPGKTDWVRLPFGRREVQVIRFYSFREAYLMEGVWVEPATGVQHSAWPEGKPQTIWLFYPAQSGKVESVTIPYGVWNGGASNGYLLTEAGIVAWYHGVHPRDRFDPGHAGLYLVNGNEGTRILAGVTGGWSVAPDGCRVAFVYRPRDVKRSTPTLRLIDVCSKNPGGT